MSNTISVKILSANRVVATLFDYISITKNLIEEQRNNSFFTKRSIKRYIKNHQIKKTVDTTITFEKNRIDRAFNIENMRNSGIILEDGENCYFTENFIGLYSDIDESEGTIYQRTSSKGNLISHLNSLETVKDELIKLNDLSSSQFKIDTQELAHKTLSQFNQMITSNTLSLKIAIKNFSSDITKGEEKLTLQERSSLANDLMQERVSPFNDFLLYAKIKESDNEIPIDLVFKNIIKLLMKKDLPILEEKYNSVSSAIKDIYLDISEEKNKLKHIIQSTRSRLEMMESSSYYLEKIKEEMEEKSDYKQRNKHLWNLSILKEFTALDNMLIQDVTKSFSPDEDYLNQNLDFLSTELFNVEIEAVEITETEKAENNKFLLEEKERKLEAKKIGEFNELIVQFKSNMHFLYKEINMNEKFDVYEFIYEKLIILSNGEYDITFNILTAVVSDFINGFKLYKQCLYFIRDTKEIIDLNMAYPCLEFYEINKKEMEK